MVLSIPGKGSGCTPTWLYSCASISNLRSATLATISSIFAQSNSASPVKFLWETLDVILTFFVYENSGENFHMVILPNMADKMEDEKGQAAWLQIHADLFRGLTQISFPFE